MLLIEPHGAGIFVFLLNTGQERGPGTCSLDHLFPPNDHWLSSDIEHELLLFVITFNFCIINIVYSLHLPIITA